MGVVFYGVEEGLGAGIWVLGLEFGRGKYVGGTTFEFRAGDGGDRGGLNAEDEKSKEG